METLYVPGIGKRLSFSCSKADTPGSAYFHHLEGSFPAGGVFVEPFFGLVLAVGLGPDPGFPSAFDGGALVLSCGPI